MRAAGGTSPRLFPSSRARTAAAGWLQSLRELTKVIWALAHCFGPACAALDGVHWKDDDVVSCLGEKSVDVVVDNVAGPAFGAMLKVVKRGGRNTSSGAIGGPTVTLDMRDFYLKDLLMIGCTAWD